MFDINDPFNLIQGDTPILVSMPHSGTQLWPEMEDRLTDEAKSLPDTDWYIPELYDFLSALNVSVISANYSRFVVDLNRSIEDIPLYTTKTTGLFPDILFSDKPVFQVDKALLDEEKERIKQKIWSPYHNAIADELQRIKQKFGYAILFDAHSIAAEVPMLFDGKLPDFNFGTNDGAACSQIISDKLLPIIEETPYSSVLNGRFKGGFITRRFGQPENNIHAVQLELSQSTYLTDGGDYELDAQKHTQVSQVLRAIIETLLSTQSELHTLAMQNKHEV